MNYFPFLLKYLFPHEILVLAKFICSNLQLDVPASGKKERPDVLLEEVRDDLRLEFTWMEIFLIHILN